MSAETITKLIYILLVIVLIYASFNVGALYTCHKSNGFLMGNYQCVIKDVLDYCLVSEMPVRNKGWGVLNKSMFIEVNIT